MLTMGKIENRLRRFLNGNGGEGQEIATRFPSSQTNRRALRLQAQVAPVAVSMLTETPPSPRDAGSIPAALLT
jgi:hypothetical protein